VQYNSLGKQSDAYDPLQHHTHYDYDADGRLTKTTYPDNTTEVTTYDNEGHRKTFTDRNNHLTTYNYDTVYQLTSTVYSDNSSTSRVYDAAGQVTSSKDANGNVTQYVYDDAGRSTQTIDALNHSQTRRSSLATGMLRASSSHAQAPTQRARFYIAAAQAFRYCSSCNQTDRIKPRNFLDALGIHSFLVKRLFRRADQCSGWNAAGEADVSRECLSDAVA
jgi:YD repeat-containing protein